MTQLWMDGFDHYGVDATGRLAMLNGAWAELDSSAARPVVPSFGARTGAVALELGTSIVSGQIARRINDSSVTELIVGVGFYTPQLPDTSNRVCIMCFVDTSNDSVVSLFLNSDGSIRVLGPTSNDNFNTGSILGTTATFPITAGTWHHVEARVVVGAGTGEVEIFVDETEVFNEVSLQTGTDNITQMVFGTPEANVPLVSEPDNTYIDDVVVRDTSGAVNNGFEGDLRVATLQPISNGTAQGWTTRSIEKLGVGVLNVVDTGGILNEGLTFADDAALEIGSSDYAIEGFFRFAVIPVLSEEMVLTSKYNTEDDNLSWKLSVFGPDADGTIEFSTSSDGTLSDIQTVHAFPFIPEVNRWYHIAVTRESSTSRLFLDGVQIGIDQTDSRTYFDGDAPVAISGSVESTTTILDDSALTGWVDGFRLTIGAARYIANFTPPTEALPTDVSGDSLYNSVELLMNFDNDAVTDESNNAFTGTLHSTAAQEIPDDSSAFQTIDGATPNDGNFVEAALIAATGTLTLTANPLDTETVTLGSFTYTFETVLTAAGVNTVLIGAAATDSLDNLRAAVNLEAGSGTLYGSGTLINTDAGLTDLPDDQILATADASGDAGNLLDSLTTVTGASWSAATLLGGQDIPDESEFDLSALPSEVTGVRAVAIVNRAFKTDSGTSTLQASFVEVGGVSSQGVARSLATSPTYVEDTFELAPSGGSLTPSTLAGARIRLDRTT